MWDISYQDKIKKCGHNFDWSRFFSHIFLVINSSINLLIYCLVGAKFRTVFCQVGINYLAHAIFLSWNIDESLVGQLTWDQQTSLLCSSIFVEPRQTVGWELEDFSALFISVFFSWNTSNSWVGCKDPWKELAMYYIIPHSTWHLHTQKGWIGKSYDIISWKVAKHNWKQWIFL